VPSSVYDDNQSALSCSSGALHTSCGTISFLVDVSNGARKFPLSQVAVFLQKPGGDHRSLLCGARIFGFFGIVAGYHAVPSFKRRAMKIKLKRSLRISPTNLALSFLEPVQLLFFRHLLLSAVIICGSRLVLRTLAVRALPSGVRSIGC